MELTIFTNCGNRKYLTSNEIAAFNESTRKFPLDVRSFCLTIAYTGCRISEALALTAANIDFEAKSLIVKCLKKRGKTVYRGIPLPDALLDLLARLVRQIDEPERRLWPWSRMTGYRRIREVMDHAGIAGDHASPKGLRHGFAVRAIQANVPLTMVQRWLGHADIKTTAIYTSAMGAEERNLAARMWQPEEQAETGAEATEPAAANDPVNRPRAKPTIPRTQPHCAAVRYRLQYRPAASVSSIFARGPLQKVESTTVPTAAARKKSLLMHLRDCALRHFWLKCNSEKCVNSSA
ncbi:tyrosine-type recombinase/integrase [Sphingomonas sp. RS6]